MAGASLMLLSVYPAPLSKGKAIILEELEVTGMKTGEEFDFFINGMPFCKF